MESRSKKSARNILAGVISKLLLMIMAFAAKTVFIRLLGVEYNGINGLCSNILSILALSELGVGNVLNFSLYSALKDNDRFKVCALVHYFRKIYLIIAAAVMGAGIALVPVLSHVVNSTLPQNEIITYYLLYLLNSTASYFAVYKTTVIIADQNGYISSICDAVITFVMYGAQIAYLIICRDFFGYLIIQLVSTIIKNVLLSLVADRMYPYLKKKVYSGELAEKKQILSNLKATFLYKISGVLLNNTDNILISIIAGTVYVGYYSNYYMLVSYIVAVIGIFITGFTASLGNLNAENNMESSYRVFNMLMLIFSFIGGVLVCCFINCMQPFIRIWLGDENVMPFVWGVVIAVNLYLEEMMNPIWIFRETMGLFRQVRYLLLITAVLNLLLSVALGTWLGVPGILAATGIAKLISQYWYEPIVLFRRKFSRSPLFFFTFQAKQAVSCSAAVIISFKFCGYIGTGLGGIIIRALISCVTALGCVLCFNLKSEAWKELNLRYIIPCLRKVGNILGTYINLSGKRRG